MKTSTILWIALVIILFGYGTLQGFNAKGSQELLETMQAIQHGATKEEVRKIMGREPAHQAPKWIARVVPPADAGEYWHYFMGYPPRNLIIYFDEQGRVVFTTWSPT